jgi:hypothetical protein
VNPAISATYEEAAREIATRLEAEHPLWLVVFGVYTKQFVCFPKFESPNGTMLIATYPEAIPDGMRQFEESAPKSQSKDQSTSRSRWVTA